jgi:uncharacterized sporulation protein YeaH/YhbH (DUF444 family)
MVHPGNQEYVTGDRIQRPQGGGGKGRARARPATPARARTIHLRPVKEEFMQVFFEDLALPP